MFEKPSNTAFQTSLAPTGLLGRYSPGEIHGLAVREILRELDKAQGNHVRAVKAGLARLRNQGVLGVTEVRDLSRLATIMHGQKLSVNSLTRIHDSFLLTATPNPVSISIAHVSVEAANQFADSKERVDLTSAAIGGAVAGALIGELIHGSSGAVFGSIMGGAFASRRVAQKLKSRGVPIVKTAIPVAQSFAVFEPLGLPGDWSPGNTYTRVLNSLLSTGSSQNSRQKKLASLRDSSLITTAEYRQLSSLIDAVQKTRKLSKLAPTIFVIHDKLLLSKDASPVALTISSIAADSATSFPGTIQEASVFGADVDGAIDGAREGFEVGGYLGHPLSGAVVGGVIGGAVSSAGAAKD